MRRLAISTLAALAFLGIASFRPYPRVSDSAFTRSPASSPGPWTSSAHSHNDFESDRPLMEALEQGFESVEADLWLQSGEIQVSHLGLGFVGTLRDLYLDPLQARVSARGSVRGDGRVFLLWLDVKEHDAEAIVPKLHELLARYPMLTRFDERAARDAPVLAILTGNGRVKTAYSRYPGRRAVRDAWRLSEDDPPVSGARDPWQWYALNWFAYMEWNGEDEIPAAEAARLKKIVALAHAKGRRLRFWGAPETQALWLASAAAGVDLIGTDDRPGMGEFISTRIARPAGPSAPRDEH